ncbi:hypothetical protein PR048_024858 [Dryococelus australis]|uniref:Uncharacterized protein n=1 Tax=Dryococelus australis TaxID=614101 RepID=A0ABQ9GPT6_9NEOP|nr:hypothetical protein PR048_024858 [Dryococelus australis]
MHEVAVLAAALLQGVGFRRCCQHQRRVLSEHRLEQGRRRLIAELTSPIHSPSKWPVYREQPLRLGTPEASPRFPARFRTRGYAECVRARTRVHSGRASDVAMTIECIAARVACPAITQGHTPAPATYTRDVRVGGGSIEPRDTPLAVRHHYNPPPPFSLHCRGVGYRASATHAPSHPTKLPINHSPPPWTTATCQKRGRRLLNGSEKFYSSCVSKHCRAANSSRHVENGRVCVFFCRFVLCSSGLCDSDIMGTSVPGLVTVLSGEYEKSAAMTTYHSHHRIYSYEPLLLTRPTRFGHLRIIFSFGFHYTKPVSTEFEWRNNVKGEGNGRFLTKPADQQHRPAQLPRAKIRERPRRKSSPVRLEKLQWMYGEKIAHSSCCNGGLVVRQLASHQGEPGSIPDGRFSRRVFLGISRFPRPFIPKPLLTHLSSPARGLKFSLLKAAQISPLQQSSFLNSRRHLRNSILQFHLHLEGHREVRALAEVNVKTNHLREAQEFEYTWGSLWPV